MHECQTRKNIRKNEGGKVKSLSIISGDKLLKQLVIKSCYVCPLAEMDEDGCYTCKLLLEELYDVHDVDIISKICPLGDAK